MIRDRRTLRIKILDQFRLLGDDDEGALPREWIAREYLHNTSRAERKNFEDALRELAARGLVETLGQPVAEVKLTEKGYNLIF